MPALLTYWRVLIETARHSQDAGSDLGSLIIDATARRRRAHGWSVLPRTTGTGAVWDTGPQPEIDFRFPGSDLPAMAFLGALAPDVMYYHRHYLRETLTDTHLHPSQAGPAESRHPPQWSHLFHHAHSGDLPILFLEQVALVPAPALRSQALAFALGYISHIAADLALNPWIHLLAPHLPLHRAPGPHVSFELLLDEYLATAYFEHPRYSVFTQPWKNYLEPAARDLCRPGTLTAQIPQLLAGAAEIYQLEGNQTETLPQDFAAGLRGLRSFLAGHGTARWLTFQAARQPIQPAHLRTLLDGTLDDVAAIPFTHILTYATRLSTHLCRLAANYYTALRNATTGAGERATRRAALLRDLRNWDLHTGYAIDETEQPALHNWVHFADLWEENIPEAPPAGLLS